MFARHGAPVIAGSLLPVAEAKPLERDTASATSNREPATGSVGGTRTRRQPASGNRQPATSRSVAPRSVPKSKRNPESKLSPYMSENILVVEYEPRYTDRVKQALAGQPFTTTFARDGEEAMKALENEPRLIVLSSVVPKISTTELIRAISGRNSLQATPILLTVSGYNGKSPKQDAQRVGASDILPKPYSEHEFLGKIQQMLGIRGELPPFEDFTVHPSADAAPSGFTSNDIFGDMLEEDKPVKKTTHTRPANEDVDKMLADTLAGMNVQRRKESPAQAPAPPAGNAAPQQAKRTGTGDLDKRLQDTL